MPSSAFSLPAFYRIWFTWVDPLSTAFGVYSNFFDPDQILNSVVPNAQRNPDHDQVFFQLGAFSLALVGIQAGLLRYSKDIRVWRIVQASILATDLALLYTLYWGFERRNTLSPALWRKEDWGCLAITGTVTAIRLAFLTGVGFRSGGQATKAY